MFSLTLCPSPLGGSSRHSVNVRSDMLGLLFDQSEASIRVTANQTFRISDPTLTLSTPSATCLACSSFLPARREFRNLKSEKIMLQKASFLVDAGLTVVVEVCGDPALLGPGVHLGQVSAQGLAVGPGTRPGEGPDNQEK